VPTIRGATGLITIPTASVTQSTSAFARSGKLVPTSTQSFALAEVGVQNDDGRTSYDAKVNPVPDVSGESLWVPAMAAGVRGVSGDNRNREYYLTLSKKFTYPESTLTLGLSRAQSWSKGANRLFYGIELPLFGGLSVLADRSARDQLTNVGARWVFGKKFCVYDYVLDYGRKGPSAGHRQNIIGACYQNRF